MTFKELINKYESILISKDENPGVVKMLILKHTKLTQDTLVYSLNQDIDFAPETFADDIARYLNGTPVQHLIGYEYFFGLKFKVENGAAFIPRPETEQLCEEVIERARELFNNTSDITLADIGTGSGAIAVTLDLNLKPKKSYATEINEQSFNVASKNIIDNGAHTDILLGNMLDPLIEKGVKLDILVSNPPYIPIAQELGARVVGYDPDSALWGGQDGLDFYREIFKNAPKLLKDKYLLAFEHGDDQVKSLELLVKTHFANSTYEFVQDFANKPRMLFIWN